MASYNRQLQLKMYKVKVCNYRLAIPSGFGRS